MRNDHQVASPLENEANPLVPTHDRIVETATALFLEHGYAGTSMSALAKACGIQKASLYHHFDGKEAVLFACFEQGYHETIERMRAAADRNDVGFADRLELVLGEVYRAMVETGAGRMAVVVAETAGRTPQVARRFNDQFIARMHALVKDFVARGMDAGEFERFDLDAFNQAVFGIAVNLTLCRLMFASFCDLEDRYAVQTVKAQHLMVLRKLLGVGEAKPARSQGDDDRHA